MDIISKGKENIWFLKFAPNKKQLKKFNVPLYLPQTLEEKKILNHLLLKLQEVLVCGGMPLCALHI